MCYELHWESLFTRSRYLQFHRFPRFSPRFWRELGPGKEKKEGKGERRFFLSLSLSLCLAYFFASIARCISRVVECKLLRAWGWFTANWFVNVVFTPLETPIFLPFLAALLASVWGETREIARLCRYLAFFTCLFLGNQTTLGRVWMVDFV